MSLASVYFARLQSYLNSKRFGERWFGLRVVLVAALSRSNRTNLFEMD
jgi:hypothetical protein